MLQPKEQNEDTFGDKGSIPHIGLAVQVIDNFWEDQRVKGVPLLYEKIENNDAPMGGLRVIQLLRASQEHLNLYEWKRGFRYTFFTNPLFLNSDCLSLEINIDHNKSAKILDYNYKHYRQNDLQQ